MHAPGDKIDFGVPHRDKKCRFRQAIEEREKVDEASRICHAARIPHEGTTLRHQHILWDWNGTLFDDAQLCVETINTVLARHGLPTITPATYAEKFFFPVRDYYEGLGFDFAKTPYEQIGTEFIELYRSRWLECRLQPDVHKTLQALSDAGLAQSVLSAHEQSTLDWLVDRMGLRRYFVRCVGLNDHYAHGKVDSGRNWLRELGRSGKEVLLVGDTVHDAEVARALGIDCILFTGGHNSPERLAASGFPVIRSLADVTRYVELAEER